MSLRHRFLFQWQNLIYSLRTIEIPQWLTGFSARFLLLLVFGLLSGAYVIKTNTLSVRGYELRDWENKVSAMRDQNQQLDIQIARSTALINLEKRVSELGMVAVKEISYIKSAPVAVAAR